MKIINVFSMSIVTMLIFISCTGERKSETSVPKGEKLNIKEAKGFRIYRNELGYTIQTVNPWQTDDTLVFQYHLVKQNAEKGQISIPVKRAVVLSTTHSAYISAIKEEKSICGLANPSFLSDSLIFNRYNQGLIKDVGNDHALNYEMILNLKPDVIFAYGIGAEALATYSRFADWNIPVVYIGEYLENTPLGKTEWVKFFSCFYNKFDEAVNIFDSVSNEYYKVKESVKNIEYKPWVMNGMPWKGVWHVAGGESFVARFFEDAGARYLWMDVEGSGGVALSMEKVFTDAEKADIWLVNSMSGSLNDVIKVDPRLRNLRPFVLDKVYNNNKRLNEGGGNDYWESGVMKPQQILRDMVMMFHHDTLVNSCFYYNKLTVK